MSKNLQVITVKADAELIEAIRAHAGPRGMTGYILGLVCRDLGWGAAPSVTRVGAKIPGKEERLVELEKVARQSNVFPAAQLPKQGHEFKAQKNAPFKCEVCGMSLGAHRG